MKQLIKYILLICIVLFPTKGIAQKELTNFLDELKNSSNPERYVPQIKDKISPYLKGPGARNNIKETFQFFTQKNSRVATCLGYLLCKSSKKPQEWYDIIKQIPTQQKFYSYGKYRDNDYYGGCLENVILFSDGRAALLEMPDVEIDSYDNLSSLTSRMPQFINDFYNEHKQTFLYNPSGNCLFGYLKEKETGIDEEMRPEYMAFELPTDDNRLYQFKDNKQYELVAGINLNFTTNTFKPTYYGYANADDAIKAKGQKEKKAEAQAQAKINKVQDAIEKKMVAKYGRKAYNAMQMLQPYVGMPEGILREMVIVSKDGQSFIPYGFINVKNGYKVYFQSKELAAMKFVGLFKAPTALYIRNGRVAAIKW